MEEIINLFGNYQMQIIVILLLVDVVLGIISAFAKKVFDFRKLGNFMKGPVLGYILGFAVIEIVGQALPGLAFIVFGVFVLVVIALFASIIRNLGKLGMPLPGILKK
ncbi:MAG: phage holin family protein [bacterium]